MRALLQRVSQASVSVGGEAVARIGRGLLVFASVGREDAGPDADWLARKIAQLRIFADEQGRMNRCVVDVGAEILAVSQFTLHACANAGNRPSFSDAAPPALARPLFDRLVEGLAERLGRPVPVGSFGAHMEVALVNDGPVTIWLDSAAKS